MTGTPLERRNAWSRELARASESRASDAREQEWRHLERAHILSQPMAGPHVKTHLRMASYAIRHRDMREVLGQLLRLVLAAPGSWSGRYPVGNTGGANVSAFRPMEVPPDLQPMLDARP